MRPEGFKTVRVLERSAPAREVVVVPLVAPSRRDRLVELEFGARPLKPTFEVPEAVVGVLERTRDAVLLEGVVHRVAVRAPEARKVVVVVGEREEQLVRRDRAHFRKERRVPDVGLILAAPAPVRILRVLRVRPRHGDQDVQGALAPEEEGALRPPLLGRGPRGLREDPELLAGLEEVLRGLRRDRDGPADAAVPVEGAPAPVSDFHLLHELGRDEDPRGTVPGVPQIVLTDAVDEIRDLILVGPADADFGEDRRVRRLDLDVGEHLEGLPESGGPHLFDRAVGDDRDRGDGLGERDRHAGGRHDDGVRDRQGDVGFVGLGGVGGVSREDGSCASGRGAGRGEGRAEERRKKRLEGIGGRRRTGRAACAAPIGLRDP